MNFIVPKKSLPPSLKSCIRPWEGSSLSRFNFVPSFSVGRVGQNII